MFTFERSTDYSLIQSIITSDRRLYDAMADDTCPAMEDFRLPEDPEAWYVIVREAGVVLGFWALLPRGATTAEVHTCLLPITWGLKARLAAKEMSGWIWRNTPFSKLVTVVPVFNRLALAFAKAAGMKEFATRQGAYLKHGKTHDLIELELCKPEVS